MKDKDRWFFEAMDILKSQGVEPVAAAHWRNPELLSIEGFDRRHLSGWRRWFWKERRQIEMGRADEVLPHRAHARRTGSKRLAQG